jgi:hypothetical protein
MAYDTRSKKKLDTLFRHIYAHFLHAFTANKTLPFHNVKTLMKFSHHEDFGIDLTFGWFGDAFLSISVQISGHFGRSDIEFLQRRYPWYHS